MSTEQPLLGKTVCVLDAYGLIYQVFHAPGMEMTNARGEPTGAIFGFVRDVLAVINKIRPDYLFCAYDVHAKTFRHEEYAEYKANRSATPDDLLLQFDFTREFLKGVGVPALGVEGFEADDILATVAKRVAELGGSTILVTADKDARQLLSNSTSIYLLRKEKYYRAEELLEDWGIRPDQVVDFQALVGDSSDNVPGVPLIGPKVASELLVKYETLEGVISGVAGLKGKRYDNIRNFQADAFLSRKLVKLCDDVQVELDWELGRLGGFDPDRLRRLFQYWNFRSLASKVDELVKTFGVAQAEPSEWFDKIEHERLDYLNATGSQALSTPALVKSSTDVETGFGACEFDAKSSLLERFYYSQYGATPKENIASTPSVDLSEFELVNSQDYSDINALHLPNPSPCESWIATIIDDVDKFSALLDRLQSAKTLAISVVAKETPELGRVRARSVSLVGLALAMETNEAFYLPFRAPLGGSTLEQQETFDALRSIIGAPKIAKIGFGLKYDALVLLDAGLQLRGIAFDAELVDYLARSGDTRRELSDIAQTYLDAELFDVKSALGVGKKRVSLDVLPVETVAKYAADQVLVPFNAAPSLRAKLLENGALAKLAIELENPLVETLAEMEYNGIAIEPKCFQEASARFLVKQEQIERDIREIIQGADADPNFAQTINLNSPKQLQRLLFDDLKLRVVRKTKTGPSVDAEVLEELASEHAVPAMIVELRKILKLRGTYLEPLPTQTLPGTERICATFNQAATSTGRLSSSDPNLQNIPARSEEGKFIREGFVPDSKLGFDAFVSCDYSQVELRVLAHYSGDAELKRAFNEDRDVHAAVAAKIFGVEPEKVTPDMRRKAKAVNFGLVYGQTAFGLSKALGISASDASAYIDAFFSTYPGVLEFFDRVLEDCAKRGYVQTALGRRRALSGVRGARGRKTLNFPERAAINAVVQGTAADIMKMAMIAVWSRLKREGWIASRWAPDAIPQISSHRKPNVDLTESPLLRFVAEPDVSQDVQNSVFEKTERARLLLQIHDELLFETRREDAQALAAIVVEEMKLGNPLTVPLKIDAEIGENWGEL